MKEAATVARTSVPSEAMKSKSPTARVFSLARHDRYDALKSLLVNREIDADLRDAKGNTLLLVACQNGHKRIVKLVLREGADADGFAEENLWTGIGRARSGCGAAIVGDPDQVLKKLKQYMDLGIEAFILSGYPHAQECDLFARYVLPELEHGVLS